MTEPRQLATVNEYTELMAALRARATELNVSRETLDAVSGLQAGYCAKLLAPVPIRAIGPSSLGPLLQALGLALIVVEDLSNFQKIEGRMRKRLRKEADADAAMPTPKRKRRRGIWRGNSDWGRVMRARATLKMSPTQIRRQAKRAANARWGKRPRKAKSPAQP